MCVEKNRVCMLRDTSAAGSIACRSVLRATRRRLNARAQRDFIIHVSIGPFAKTAKVLYSRYMNRWLVGIIAVALLIGAGWLLFGAQRTPPPIPATTSSTDSSGASRTTTQEGGGASALAACQAGCRNQYGGSGSAGFDACIRGCGAVGAAGGAREAACAGDGPACPTPQSPVCHDGTWYCRQYSNSRKNVTFELNFSTDVQMREAACGEPGLACESPAMPECRNGKWICVGPATGVR